MVPPATEIARNLKASPHERSADGKARQTNVLVNLSQLLLHVQCMRAGIVGTAAMHAMRCRCFPTRHEIESNIARLAGRARRAATASRQARRAGWRFSLRLDLQRLRELRNTRWSGPAGRDQSLRCRGSGLAKPTVKFPARLGSIDDLRVAGAKVQADLLLVYTIDTSFRVQGKGYGPLTAGQRALFDRPDETLIV
jgi:hypothetical protein